MFIQLVRLFTLYRYSLLYIDIVRWRIFTQYSYEMLVVSPADKCWFIDGSLCTTNMLELKCLEVINTDFKLAEQFQHEMFAIIFETGFMDKSIFIYFENMAPIKVNSVIKLRQDKVRRASPLRLVYWYSGIVDLEDFVTTHAKFRIWYSTKIAYMRMV